jgi:transcription-repair coupling factor (superfamily II helicase)
MTGAAVITCEPDDAPAKTRRSLAAQALRLANAARKAGRKGMIHLAKDDREAERIAALARRLAPDVAVLAFPAWDSLPYDGASPSRECIGRRMQTLHALAAEQSAPWLLVATVEAVLQRVPPRRL